MDVKAINVVLDRLKEKYGHCPFECGLIIQAIKDYEAAKGEQSPCGDVVERVEMAIKAILQRTKGIVTVSPEKLLAKVAIQAMRPAESATEARPSEISVNEDLISAVRGYTRDHVDAEWVEGLIDEIFPYLRSPEPVSVSLDKITFETKKKHGALLGDIFVAAGDVIHDETENEKRIVAFNFINAMVKTALDAAGAKYVD